jgi:hypothetical protein
MNDIKRLSTEKVTNTCKIGQGNECCRYLVVGASGFECVKATETKEFIDSRVKKAL